MSPRPRYNSLRNQYRRFEQKPGPRFDNRPDNAAVGHERARETDHAVAQIKFRQHAQARMEQIDCEQILELVKRDRLSIEIMRSIDHEHCCLRHNRNVVSELQNALADFEILAIHEEVPAESFDLLEQRQPAENHAT